MSVTGLFCLLALRFGVRSNTIAFMRVGPILLIALSVGMAVGCRRSEPKPEPVKKVDSFASWPPDTIAKPEFLGAVERQAGYVKGDAEPSRIPSVYQIPDWAEPTSTISAKGPKGSSLTFHLLPHAPELRKQDDARIANLLKGKKFAAETLIVARPWIGWFGQGSGTEVVSAIKSRPYTLRVYMLFSNDLQLEVHLQWPTGDKDAYEEGQELLAHLLYSVQRK